MQMENIVTGSHHQLIGANIFATCDTIILRIQPGNYENDELCDFCLISFSFSLLFLLFAFENEKIQIGPQ